MSLSAIFETASAADTWVQASYMLAALLFILGIKRLARVRTAQSGNQIAAVAMLLAICVTVWHLWGEGFDHKVLFGGLALGGVIGLLLAKRVQMTSMPELVALFNGAWPCHFGAEDDDTSDGAAGCYSFTIVTDVT